MGFADVAKAWWVAFLDDKPLAVFVGQFVFVAFSLVVIGGMLRHCP